MIFILCYLQRWWVILNQAFVPFLEDSRTIMEIIFCSLKNYWIHAHGLKFDTTVQHTQLLSKLCNSPQNLGSRWTCSASSLAGRVRSRFLIWWIPCQNRWRLDRRWYLSDAASSWGLKLATVQVCNTAILLSELFSSSSRGSRLLYRLCGQPTPSHALIIFIPPYLLWLHTISTNSLFPPWLHITRVYCIHISLGTRL